MAEAPYFITKVYHTMCGYSFDQDFQELQKYIKVKSHVHRKQNGKLTKPLDPTTSSFGMTFKWYSDDSLSFF